MRQLDGLAHGLGADAAEVADAEVGELHEAMISESPSADNSCFPRSGWSAQSSVRNERTKIA